MLNYEGCATMGGIWGVVPRSEEIEVEALDRYGNLITIRATGRLAGKLEHEIDHTLGIEIDGRTKILHNVEPHRIKSYREGGWRNWKRICSIRRFRRIKDREPRLVQI